MTTSNHRIVIATAAAIIIIIAAVASHSLSAAKRPPGDGAVVAVAPPGVPEAEDPWTAALTAHSRFVADSKHMSPAERKVALQQLAGQFAKSLHSAPAVVVPELEHRLLGIYTSLGDLQSAITINQELLSRADADEVGELNGNLAELQASLAMKDPKNLALSEQALAQVDRAVAALEPGKAVEQLIAMLSLKAQLLADAKRLAEAMLAMRKAIDACKGAPKGGASPLQPHECARLVSEMMSLSAPMKDEHVSRACLDELRAMHDSVYSPGRAVLEFHTDRGTLGDESFAKDALQILGGDYDKAFAEIRISLCKYYYEPKKDNESIVMQLTALLNNKDIERSTDSPEERKELLHNWLPGAYSSLADSLLAMGEKAQAETYYVKLSTEFPDHPYGKLARKVLENWRP